MALDLLKQEVMNIFQARRQVAQGNHELKLRSIYEAHPELKSFDDLVHETGYKMALLALKEMPDEAALAEAKQNLDEALEEQALMRDRLGYQPMDFEVTYHCPKCEDQGYIEGRECSLCFATTRSKVLQEKFNQVMPKVGTLDDYSIDVFTKKPVRLPDGSEFSVRQAMSSYYEDAKEFVADFDEATNYSLFFAGGTGTGKSTLAAAIGQTLLEQGHSVLFLSAFELAGMLEELRTIRRAFSPNPERLSELEGTISIIKECDLLIIDDLGDERDAYRQSANDFLQLLNERYPAGKKMIWIANDSPDAIQEAYSETIFSRLFGYGKTLYFFGEDQRIRRRLDTSEA